MIDLFQTIMTTHINVKSKLHETNEKTSRCYKICSVIGNK